MDVEVLRQHVEYDPVTMTEKLGAQLTEAGKKELTAKRAQPWGG